MDSERRRLTSQLQEALQKITKLQQINSELTQIIQSSELPDYKQLHSRLAQNEQYSSQTIAALQLKISHLQAELAFQSHRSEAKMSELLQKLQMSEGLSKHLKHSLNMVIQENCQLKKQLHGQRNMIKNQEHLIDDYKRSIQEEKQIERQIAKCQVKEIENKLKKEMNKKVLDIKEKHERKLAKMNKENISNSYKKQIDNLKHFITAKKSQIKQNQKQQPSHSNFKAFNPDLSKSISSKKQIQTQQKCLGKEKLTVNQSDLHILIFDEGQQSSNLFPDAQKEKENRKVINFWNQTNGTQAMKSLNSTLESEIHNFKSNQINQSKKYDSFNNFDSIKINRK